MHDFSGVLNSYLFVKFTVELMIMVLPTKAPFASHNFGYIVFLLTIVLIVFPARRPCKASAGNDNGVRSLLYSRPRSMDIRTSFATHSHLS